MSRVEQSGQGMLRICWLHHLHACTGGCCVHAVWGPLSSIAMQCCVIIMVFYGIIVLWYGMPSLAFCAHAPRTSPTHTYTVTTPASRMLQQDVVAAGGADLL